MREVRSVAFGLAWEVTRERGGVVMLSRCWITASLGWPVLWVDGTVW